MPRRAATIESLAMAFEVVKQMQADGLDWGEGYRPLGCRISNAIRQPYGLYRLKQVCFEIPALRHISSTLVPSSAWCRMNAIFRSLYFDLFSPRSPDGHREPNPELSPYRMA